MIRLHTRYVFRRFLGFFALCLLSAVFMFLVIDLVGNSKIWLDRQPREVYAYYLNYLPHIVYLILPVALLLASVFAVGQLAKNLEITALKAAGVSLLRILSPILLFGLLVTAIMFHFGNTLLPESNHRRFQINEPKTPEGEAGDPMEKFNFVFTGSDHTLYYFEYYSAHRKSGQRVTLMREEKGRIVKRYDAQGMDWDLDGWKLENGTSRSFEKGAVVTESFKTLKLKLADKPEDLIYNRIYPDEMTLKELEKRIAVLKRSGEPTRVFETQRLFRFSSPFVNLFMVVIGISLAAGTVKAGLARNFGLALLITFLYYVALRVGLVMGENGSLTPAEGAWLGNALFAPFGLFLLWRASRT